MVQRIDSVLFNKLLQHNPNEMDYTLVGVYCMLKKNRNKIHSYQPHSKLSGYKLLRYHTGISISVLYKNVPLLIEMGLCHFLDNGGFFMLGNQKTKSNKHKLVPVRVYDKLTITKTAVKYVIEHSNLLSQKRKTVKKERQSELLSARDNGRYLTKGQRLLLRKLSDKGISCRKDLKIVKTENLSNRRIGELLYGGTCDHNKKSRGKYAKKRFSQLGLHNAKRRFERVSDTKYTFEQYSKLKYGLREYYGNITWMNGRLYTELSNEIQDISDGRIKKSVVLPVQVEKREHIEDYMRLKERDGSFHPFLIQKSYLHLVGGKKNNIV